MKKRITSILATIMAVCLLASCAGTGTQSGSGVAGSRTNNILTVALRGATTGTMHPDFSVTAGQDRNICFVLYQPLVRIGAGNELKGVLAESWEVSEDQQTITFYLRKGVKWHDGEDFTAEDVKYTYTAAATDGYTGYFASGPRNILGVEEYNQGLTDEIEGIEIIDDHTISITTDGVYGSFFYNIAELCSIVPEHIWSAVAPDKQHEATDLLKNPVGTGAFKFREYVPDQYVILDAFEDYWGGAPKIESIVFKPMSADVGPSAVVGGEADLHQTSMMDPETIEMLTSAGCTVQELWWTSIRYLILNCENPLLKQKEVRQALAYAMDRAGIAENIFYGYGRVENTFLISTQWGYPGDDNINHYGYDPELAIQMLEKAGWEYKDGVMYADGNPVSFHLDYPTGNPNVEKIALVLQQNYKDIGIELTVSMLEMAAFNEKMKSDDFDMGMLGNGSPDPDMSRLYGTDGVSNYQNYNDPHIDELFAQGLQYVDQSLRSPFYEELAIYINDVLPMIPIVSWCDGLIVAPGLEGVVAQEEAAFMYANIENWYFSNLAA